MTTASPPQGQTDTGVKPSTTPPAEREVDAGAPPVQGPTPSEIVAVAEQKLPIAALTDWVTFLQGPASPPFKEDCRFEGEWKRLFRLLSLVLLMLGAIIVVFSLGLAAPGQKWQDLATKSQYLFLVLVIGAVVAVPYSFVLAPLFRIRITFAQTFFVVLLLGLPWLPLIALVWAIGKVWTGGLVISIFLYILCLAAIYNFCKGVSVIARCKLWRPVISLFLPMFLALAIFVANYVWE